MNEPSQRLASSFTLQQLLDELEDIIVSESQRTGNPWIISTRLNEMFVHKYGVLPGDVAKAQGYANSLRKLLEGGKRFSIYGTQYLQDFYAALMKSVVPDSQFYPTSKRPVQRKVERTGRTDAEATSKHYPRNTVDSPHSTMEIESVDDLERILIDIVRGSTANNPANFLTISALSKEFRDRCKQPIRTAIRNLCPDMSLTELLQVIPSLYVQQTANGWQVALSTAPALSKADVLP